MDSTSLRFGFTEREYYKVTLLPQYRVVINSNESITYKLGTSFDYSNRNGSKFSPIGEIGFLRSDNLLDSEFLYISFAQKVPNLRVIQPLLVTLQASSLVETKI